MPRERCSKTEKDHRVDAAYDMLVDGHRPSRIVKAMTEAYSVSTRTAERYVYEAKKLLPQHIDDLARKPLLNIEQAEKQYRKANETGNINAALKSLTVQQKLRDEVRKNPPPPPETGIDVVDMLRAIVEPTYRDVMREEERKRKKRADKELGC